MTEKQARPVLPPAPVMQQFAGRASQAAGGRPGQSITQNVFGENYIAGPNILTGDKPMMQHLQDQQLQLNVQQAQQGMYGKRTQQGISSAIRGLLALFGIDWTPEIQKQIGSILNSLPGQFLGPWLNSATGYAFDAGDPIASAIQRAGNIAGMNPQQAIELGDHIAEAFSTDPNLRAGFSPAEMGELIVEAAKSKQLPLGDKEQLADKLRELTGSLHATRGKLKSMGGPTDVKSIWSSFVQGGGIRNPKRYADMMRVSGYATEAGGEAGVFGAAATAGGGTLQMSPKDVAQARSAVWQRVQRDWTGNAAAATARFMADESFQFASDPKSRRAVARAQSMINDMANGEMPETYGEWEQAMNGAFVDADGSRVAPREIYNDSNFNKQTYLADNPQLQNAVMASSLNRWKPRMASINKRWGKPTAADERNRARALNSMVEQSFQNVPALRSDPHMSAGEKFRYITDPETGQQSVNLMNKWQNRARQEDIWRGHGRGTTLAKSVRGLQQYKQPKGPTDWLDLGIQTLGGGIRKDQVPAGATTAHLPGNVPAISDFGLRRPTPPTPKPAPMIGPPVAPGWKKTAAAKETLNSVDALCVAMDLLETKFAKKAPTLAVDLDGTLAKHYDSYDEKTIPAPRPSAKLALEKFKEMGCRIIINTVRGDRKLVKSWLDEHDIPHDYINENPDQPDGTSDKIIADLYIDDRGVDARASWDKLVKKVKARLQRKAA